MSQDNSTDSTLPGDQGSGSSDGGAAVDSTLTLSELNTYLGKDFKDKTSALKALKDTQSFVGKRKEDIQAEVLGGKTQGTTSIEGQVQTLAKKLFYSENPQFKGYEKIIDKMGSDPAEVVNSEEFQSVFEKGKVADEVQSSRSVVSSNSRVGQVKVHTDRAVEMANAMGSSKEDVAALLADAIKEEFQLE